MKESRKLQEALVILTTETAFDFSLSSLSGNGGCSLGVCDARKFAAHCGEEQPRSLDSPSAGAAGALGAVVCSKEQMGDCG